MKPREEDEIDFVIVQQSEAHGPPRWRGCSWNDGKRARRHAAPSAPNRGGGQNERRLGIESACSRRRQQSFQTMRFGA